MRRIVELLSILTLLLISGVSAQRAASASSTSSASASTSFSVASSQFTSSLEQATEQIVPKLEADPQNLDQVLEAIAQAIVAELEKVAVALIQETSIDATSVASEVGQAVSSALTSITQVQAYAELDVDSVVAQVESSVETILGKISAQPNVAQITEDLANAVIGAIGDAISEVSGATFTFKVEVSSSATTTTTNSSIISTSEESTPISTSSSILRLLQTGDIQGVIEAMSMELTSGSEVVLLDFLIQASSNNTLQPSLVEVFTGIFASENFPMERLVDILVTDAGSESISIVLQNAISAAVAAGEVAGLGTFFQFAFQGESSTTFEMLVVQSIEGVIAESGCQDELAGVLAAASQESVDFLGAIVGSANISACASYGLENQLYLLISSQLQSGDIETAFENLQNAQGSTIVASFVFSLSAGLSNEVSDLLIKFYEDDTITSKKLSLVIALFMRQDAQNATKIILDSISNTQDISSLIATFKYAFTQAESQVTEEFITLIARSIEGGSCGLSTIVDGVLADVNTRQAKSITEQLVNGDAEACLPTIVAPVTEPMPTPTPTPSPARIPAPTPTAPTAPPPTPTPTAPPPTPVDEQDDEPEAEDEEDDQEVTPPSLSPPSVMTPSPTPSPEDEKEDVPEEPPSLAEPPSTSIPLPEDEKVDVPEETSSLSPSPEGEEEDIPVVEVTTSPPEPSPEAQVDGCVDVAPPGGYTCEQQAAYGKCTRGWMMQGGFCAKTCGFCCDDVQPDDRYTCAQQKEFGKCNSPWMIEGKFCRSTCGNCNPDVSSPTPTPSPIPTNDKGCDCGCGCGCNAEYAANMTANIVRDVLIQVLKELQD